MLPIIAGVVAVAAVAGGVYSYVSSKRAGSEVKKPEPKCLGDFAVWGQPDTGKTTFIARLRGVEPGEKEQTTSLKRYGRFRLKGVDGGPFEIKALVDMPGSRDRLDDWLAQVESNRHVFYVVSLAKVAEEHYRRKVRFDIERTVERLAAAGSGCNRVNIIGTHLDQSEWKSVDEARVNNVIMQDPCMREVRELFGAVAGYVYSANLMDKNSAARLLQDLVNDCNG